MIAPADLPPLIRPGIALLEREWEILQVWANNHALAARAERDEANKELAKEIVRQAGLLAQRDAEIERLKESVRDRAASECIQYERAEAAEARVKKIEQLATPAVIETFFGLNNRTIRAEEQWVTEMERADVAQERAAKFEGELAELVVERDALRARLEAIEKQPTSAWLLPNGSLTEFEKLAVTFDGAIELIERPNMDRNADSPAATAEGQRASEGEVGPPR